MILKGESLDKVVSNTKLAEGLKQVLYKDSRGNNTYGYGHKASKPISEHICFLILMDDLSEAEAELAKTWPTYSDLDDARKGVVVDMAFNLGVQGFMGFKDMRAAIVKKDWVTASKEILNSTADHQEPMRCQKWAYRMEYGVF